MIDSTPKTTNWPHDQYVIVFGPTPPNPNSALFVNFLNFDPRNATQRGYIDGVVYEELFYTGVAITTASLPNAVAGTPYATVDLQAVGGSGHYGWTVVSGTLPTGFSLLTTGALSDPNPVATTPGLYTFTVQASDLQNSGAPVSTRALSLMVLPSVAILDPVPTLLDGPQITYDSARLATDGRPVQGVAADGIAQVVFRVPTVAAGDTVTAVLCTDKSVPPNCVASNSSDDNGGLFNVGSAVTSNASLPNTASDTSDSTTHDAFIAYRAPVDFARSIVASDANAASRNVYIQFNYSRNGTVYGVQAATLTIVRPPLFLLHGFNSDSSDWLHFTPLIDDPRFKIYRPDYGSHLFKPTYVGLNPPTYKPVFPQYNIVGTTPDIDISYIHQHALLSHLGFTVSSARVSQIILGQIESFKNGDNPLAIPTAAVQADVVAHSMGGLVIRNWAQNSDGTYKSESNYGQGGIHKLITLGTPHFGTPQAILSTLPQSACSRNKAANFGKSLFFSSAKLEGKSTTIAGAAGELGGDGVGTVLSDALMDLKRSGVRIPTAPIAGDVSSLLGPGGGLSPTAGATYSLCYALALDPVDPLAARYTKYAYESIFDPHLALAPLTLPENSTNTDSDGSVPLSSALLNSGITTLTACESQVPGECFDQYTHSPGIAVFFSGAGSRSGEVNYLQDDSGMIAARVLYLLNSAVTDKSLFIQSAR